jgi:cytochrome b
VSSPELLSDFGAVDGAPAARDATRGVVLWDLPLRAFHWLLVAAVTAAIVTGELGGAWMPWHGRAGLLIVGLLVFRVLWGLVGSATSRFTQFAPTPARLLAYLRGRWRGVGHNPLGALSVFALLGLLSLQAATGLFGNDDIAFAGPLNHLVDDDAGARATSWHRWLANGLIALVVLHLLAIALHVLVKRHRLVRPMITGRHQLEPGRDWPRPRGYGRYGVLSAVVVAASAVLALASAGQAPVAGASTAVKPAVVATPAGVASAPAW